MSWQRKGEGGADTTQATKANVDFRAMQFSYSESEDGGGSNAKRHLASGPEIHLKLLIPRFTKTFRLHMLLQLNKIYDVKISAMLLGMSLEREETQLLS